LLTALDGIGGQLASLIAQVELRRVGHPGLRQGFERTAPGGAGPRRSEHRLD